MANQTQLPANHEDRKYVSFEDEEIAYVAKKFNIPRWVVTRIKEHFNLRNRKKIYDKVKEYFIHGDVIFIA